MEDFEQLVEEALGKIPFVIREKIKNVAVCVEKEPSGEQLKKLGVRYGGNLLGLYEGIPKNVWGRGFGNNLPDKITIFEDSIKKTVSNKKDLENLIIDVVWHEIAHHFGFNEKEVRMMEKRKKFLI